MDDQWDATLQAICRQAAQKPGLRVLLSGPFAATVAGSLATEMNRRLHRVALSAVVGQYIGETEKNLAVLVKEAVQGAWILFFDEADALFGKRTKVKDAHDRYANLEVSYLLQRLEDFPGMVILATNTKASVDSPFVQHFDVVLDLTTTSRFRDAL